MEETTSGTLEEDGKNYQYCELTAKRTVPYSELIDTTGANRFYIIIKGSESGSYLISHAELFAKKEGKAKVGEGYEYGFVLPNGRVAYGDGNNLSVSKEVAESEVRTTHYYYNKLETTHPDEGGYGKTSPEEIEYLYIGDKKGEYKPIYTSSFEKNRSISKKESNRFDLLQTLSETFECWCKFNILHEDNGRIKLDEKYKQQKFITFHNQIGQRKSVGFKYGINLKSISRNVDSNNIATKLIVKSNTNAFANGGSCNIALAKENPSGENFIYDFSYYVNHGLLNDTNLTRDLYS